MINTTGGRFYQLLPEKENTEDVELEMFSLISRLAFSDDRIIHQLVLASTIVMRIRLNHP